ACWDHVATDPEGMMMGSSFSTAGGPLEVAFSKDKAHFIGLKGQSCKTSHPTLSWGLALFSGGAPIVAVG
ncbi:MAG TPA: hypothetical protein VH025_05880, partial [Solirubrobacteraceae bacterium]|nr:hypothetical protein [Solirubrobacteraceae bacterium]